MSELLQHQRNLQAVTELIESTLGVDVFVVDDQMVAMAGTGPYRNNIGTKRPRDSYVDVTINQGDSQTVIDPRYTHQCYRCEYRSLCPYSMVMCRPLVKQGRIKGLIGFLGFSEKQRRNMIARSSLLCDLSERLGYIWETKDLDLYQFFRHPKTHEFINLFEEGLVLTTPDYQVLNLNQRAQRFLGVDGQEAAGKRLSSLVGRELSAGTSARTDGGFVKTNKKLEYALAGGDGQSGRLVVLSDKARSTGNWQGCPLTGPALSMIVGTSEAIMRLREQAANVARGNSTVLLAGETGVGKELAARYIHQMSRRWAGPFETVNCAAIPDSLFESEFFGYAPGAFTGAGAKGKIGTFSAAHGGTIFLDEVSRLSLSNQAKILRVLEDGLVQKLGDEQRQQVDVRVLAATNINLEQAVAENRFLPDLYYRLAVIPLSVPPLRDRSEDIPLLLEYFQGLFTESLPDIDFLGFSPEVLDFLRSHHWPGNVRELKNLMEYVMNIVRGREVVMTDLPAHHQAFGPKPAPLSPHRPVAPLTTLEEMEAAQIRLALKTFGHGTAGKRRAARHLGISLSTLYRRLSRSNPAEL